MENPFEITFEGIIDKVRTTENGVQYFNLINCYETKDGLRHETYIEITSFNKRKFNSVTRNIGRVCKIKGYIKAVTYKSYDGTWNKGNSIYLKEIEIY